MEYPKVAIIYLSYHSEIYLDDAISALEKSTYPKERVEFVVVDNPHPQAGSSMRALEEKLMPISGKTIPHVTLLPQAENLGFAGGNNVGIAWALKHGFDYIYFHNNDGFMAADCLEKMVRAMEKDSTIGAAQSLLLLYPETDLVNTAGNSFHYLGFGYCGSFRFKKSDLQLQEVQEVGYASGASIIMRARLLTEYGFWDKDFFMYHEDLEYSLRMKAVGYKVSIIRDAIFYHKYQFSRNKDKFYNMERNRFAVMLMYFKWPTLLLLLPMAIIMEAGLVLFSIMAGWFSLKMQVYTYWLTPRHWALWLEKRKHIQSIRKVSDSYMLATAVDKVIFDEKDIDNPLLKYVANPLMTAYWFVAKRIIFW
ncbi:MAG: glycosyltransferase family 2 protein [Candidatus Magasanikbacteria bacterium]|nr:glycosyltransferase family 2 protein [Candidatus Magasanikbacteria bacterium]